MLSDDPDFNRQRRNVIVTGSIIWALFIAGIDAGSLLPNHATVRTPCNLDLLAAIVVLYFLWRLFQVSHDMRAKRRSTWSSGIQGQLNRKLHKLRQLQLQIEQAKQQISNEEVTRQKFELKFETVETVSIKNNFICGLRFAITFEDGEERERRKSVTVNKYGITGWQISLPTYFSLAFRTTYFTDYTLAYLVGGTAALISISKFVSCLV